MSHRTRGKDLPISLDPGMSFGTGLHPTTRMCIRLIETLASAGITGSFLDVGCGSGILSIAASLLGFSPVTGIDIDPLAISSARKNAGANKCRCSFSLADAADIKRSAGFKIVAANMLAQELERNAPAIARAVSRQEGSHLILSGMLANQYSETVRIFQKLGFSERSSLSEKGWKSACLHPKPRQHRKTALV